MAEKGSRKINKRSKNDITSKFKKMVQEFMDEHADVLRKLAKR